MRGVGGLKRIRLWSVPKTNKGSQLREVENLGRGEWAEGGFGANYNFSLNYHFGFERLVGLTRGLNAAMGPLQRFK